MKILINFLQLVALGWNLSVFHGAASCKLYLPQSGQELHRQATQSSDRPCSQRCTGNTLCNTFRTMASPCTHHPVNMYTIVQFSSRQYLYALECPQFYVYSAQPLWSLPKAATETVLYYSQLCLIWQMAPFHPLKGGFRGCLFLSHSHAH